MHCTRSFFVAMPLGFLMSLGLYMSLIYAQLGAPTATSYWCAEITRKKLESAAHTPSPKLVLMGGSATLFSLKASILERELGVPSLNAATHAGLGLAYLLERGKRFLRPGDTVVLMPEFELFIRGDGDRRAWANSIYVDYILARDPDYYRSLPLPAQMELALMMPFKRLTNGLANLGKPEQPIRFSGYKTYDPALVDSHGDMTGHSEERRPAISRPRDTRVCLQLLVGLPRNASGFPLLAGFCKWASGNHIRVLAGFPNLAYRPVYDKPAARALESQLREFYAELGVPVVGRLHDTFRPTSEFFDSNYHMTEQASVLQTIRVAAQLKPWFPTTAAVVPPVAEQEDQGHPQ